MSSDRSGPQSDSSISSTFGLPLVGVPATAERADASRNRLKVLAAAESLFETHGVSKVSMDDVARAAGVGKGTLYRRFGDKSGLAQALLSERERELQEAMIEGPPPLGPGAEVVDRLVAFATTYAEFVARHLDLVLMSETATPGARPHIGANRLWRLHCRGILEAAGVPGAKFRADALLATMSAEQIKYWISAEDPTDGVRALPTWVVDGLSSLCRSLMTAEPR
jgi:AcrR family transcriptional regulator